MWDLSSPTRDQTHTPCIGRQSLNHRTAREVPRNPFFYFLFFIFYFFLFLAVLSLRCCSQAFSSCGEQGLLFVVVHRLLTVVASLVAEHGL